MADPQDAIRGFFDYLEPYPIIADSQTQVAAAFQFLDLAFAARGVIGKGIENLKRLLAINRADLLLGALGPDKCAHAPNSRKTSSCVVPAPVSLRADSTSARSCSVSGSSSSGAVRIDCQRGSASTRRILRAAGRSPAGM